MVYYKGSMMEGDKRDDEIDFLECQWTPGLCG